MSLALIIIINVALDAAILGTLAFVMSRAASLEPHRPLTPATSPPPRPAAAGRTSRALCPALRRRF